MNDRSKFIGGTDAMRIMKGEWLDLWREKTGRKEAEDLSGVFPVQLGILTEPFHLSWIQDPLGPINPNIDPKIAREFTYLRATIDGWLEDHNTFVEVKHTGGFEDIDTLLDRYMPQLALYSYVYERDHCYFSVIMGNREPRPIRVEMSPEYRQTVIDMCVQFWWHVLEDSAPEDTEANPADPFKDLKIDDMIVKDMTGNNEWAFLAGIYIEHESNVSVFNQAKKELKDMVEGNVREASGHGITIKRDKRGSLRFTVNADE